MNPFRVQHAPTHRGTSRPASTHAPINVRIRFSAQRPQQRGSFHPPLGARLILASLLLLAVPTAAHAEALLLRGGLIHTVSGRTLTNASLLARDGRIAALGTDLSAEAAQVIDLEGRHLYPGLIAPSTILGLSEIPAVRATRDQSEVGDFTPDVYAWVAIHTDSELIPVARANGYTHAQSVPSGGVVSGHSALIALSGWTIEDVAVRKAVALHVRWPSFELDTRNRDRASKLEDQVKERDRRIKAIDDFFVDAEAYARTRPDREAAPEPLPGEPARRHSPEAHTIIPAWEAMLPALRGEIPVFLHADEPRQIQSAIEWAHRRKLRAVLAGGRDAWRVASTLARENIPVVFDDVFTQPARDIDPYDVQFSAPAALARVGVKVSFGGGGGRSDSSDIRNIPYAAAQAVAFGLPPDEALRGLTLYPAQALGVDDTLGSLEIGKEASFFIADGDILDIRSHVIRMWIAGREVSLESRHTRLRDRYQARPRPPQEP